MIHKSPLNLVLSILRETWLTLKASESHAANRDDLKISWAERMLSLLNVRLTVKGEVCELESSVFIGNHVSYIDIPLITSLVRGVSFVAKQELSRWPIFGYGARQMDTVFVKRGHAGSRGAARNALMLSLEQGKRITLFPSGTTAMGSSPLWRRGGFEVVHKKNAWVQPFRISYQPVRAVAFIGDDNFLPHLYRLSKLPGIDATVEFHSPVKIEDPIKDCLKWKNWCEQTPAQVHQA